MIGSFLAVVSIRLPNNHSLISPPSHCDHCKARLHPLEMIPLFSAIFQCFRCTHCLQRFSARSFGLELFCGILFCWCMPEFQWFNLWKLLWLLSTLVLAVIDWEFFIVEMRIFLLSGIFLFITALFLLPNIYWWQPLYAIVIFFFSQKILPNSLGLGDLWIIGLWSFFLSSYELIQILFVASLTGIIYYLYHSLHQRRLERLPFVPFLFIGLLYLLVLKH
ncbi:prepilin peptidase [Enterococcus hermanniensis]|uniref:prepilin peptidase n=1 Tax=Enterococcus hermanniensis TaxID=249189 RepID=UPI003608112D